MGRKRADERRLPIAGANPAGRRKQASDEETEDVPGPLTQQDREEVVEPLQLFIRPMAEPFERPSPGPPRSEFGRETGRGPHIQPLANHLEGEMEPPGHTPATGALGHPLPIQATAVTAKQERAPRERDASSYPRHLAAYDRIAQLHLQMSRSPLATTSPIISRSTYPSNNPGACFG